MSEEVVLSLATLVALLATFEATLSSSGASEADLLASGWALPVEGRPARLVGRECGGVRRLVLLLCDDVREWRRSDREGVIGRCNEVEAAKLEVDASGGLGSGGRSGSISKCSFRVGWWIGSCRLRCKWGCMDGCGETLGGTAILWFCSDKGASEVFLDMEPSTIELLLEPAPF